ncbi:unnamed protein product [Diamesa hyperborea]
MVKFIATIKAIITRIMFGTHGAIAIWQVTQYKKNPIYWSLSAPIGLLVFEGIFTLGIKKSQEWRWFCPSVFLYLSSVVPAIWLLELDKVERRHKIVEETFSLVGAAGDLKQLDKLLGMNIKLPDIQINAETWVTLIEQFLMLVLIIGRWLLPKGDLTRDQLSQLLLVYIGTAADIIEFFDSFKDNKIASEPILVFLTLSIWSWSLMQFTIVLTATRARKSRGGGTNDHADEESNMCCSECCCSIDIWGIAFNIILQDAPFLTFRLLIIIHYQIISYMNVFFTCKNTLVILLQLYRLYVVQSENNKSKSKKKKLKYHQDQQRKQKGSRKKYETEDIYIISNEKSKRKKRLDTNKSARKDTGYSTASSHEEKRKSKDSSKKKDKRKSKKDEESPEKRKRRRSQESVREEEEKSKRRSKREKCIEEKSESDSASERSTKKKTSKKKRSSSSKSSSASE